jgi:hypothetical protein
MVMSIAATSSSMMRYMPIAPTQQTAQVARQGAPAQSVDGASPPPPPKGADNRQKLQDLLSQQVDAGAISQDQATLLSDFFAKVASKGGPNGGGMGGDNDGDNDKGAKDDGPGGTEGPGAAGRRPPPPPPAADQATATDTNASSPLKDALDAFLKALKDNQTKATAYGAAVAAPPTSTALFVDKLV